MIGRSGDPDDNDHVNCDDKYRLDRRPAPTKEAIITDLKRVAGELGHDTVRYHEYIQHGGFTIHAVTKLFKLWNIALREAGLRTTHQIWTDGDFLAGVKAVWDHLRRRPSYQEYKVMGPKLGHPGISALEDRFGSFTRALDQLFGAGPDHRPLPPRRRTRAPRRAHGTGAPISHPQMTYAPTSENAVLVLLGIMADDLGLIIESVRGAFPDVAAKRLDPVTKRYVSLEIEVELYSSHFKDHGHPVDQGVAILCWEHDWKDCPPDIEVIELKAFTEPLRRR